MSQHHIEAAYRAALLRGAAQLPKRRRHQFLRQRLAQLKAEQAPRSAPSQKATHP